MLPLIEVAFFPQAFHRRKSGSHIQSVYTSPDQDAHLCRQDVAVEENFRKAESFIRNAASQGAHLAVLPEYHLTSWCPENPDFVSAGAETAKYLPKYQELARELNINIVPGTIFETVPFDSAASVKGNSGPSTIPQLDGKPVEIRNMTYFICAGTGEIAGSYQKKNLWHPERPHLTADIQTPHTAFDTPLKRADGTPLRAGLLICWDLAFPEAFRALMTDGAELILVPSFWAMDDVEPEARELNPNCERIFLSSTTVRARVRERVRHRLREQRRGVPG